MIQVNVTNIGATQHHVPPDMKARPSASTKSYCEKTLDKPKLRDVPQNNWSALLQK